MLGSTGSGSEFDVFHVVAVFVLADAPLLLVLPFGVEFVALLPPLL